jgi:hypothetical protein
MRAGDRVRAGALSVLVGGAWGVAFDIRVDAATLRVVSYNVAADVASSSPYGSPDGTPDETALRGVFRAIGQYRLAGNAQAVDVISVQELYQNPTDTLDSIVTSLNSEYGAGTYAYASGVSNTTGNWLTGNGPSGLIYNTKTVSVVGFQNVGLASGVGAPRTPSRYTLQAVGHGAASQFYVYSQHAKAGGDTTSVNRRTIEFDAVRADADALGAGAHIIYTGDYNLVYGATEQAYQDLTAAAGTTLASGAVAGAGRAYDPLGSSFTQNSAGSVKYYTESATGVSIRFDYQLVSAAMLSSGVKDTLRLVNNSYAAFGLTYYNGTALAAATAYNGNIATALTDASGVSQTVRTYLTQLSDHLPVVSDYAIVVPEPGTLAAVCVVGLLTLRRRRAAL